MVLLLTAESRLNCEISGILESSGYRWQAMDNPAELWNMEPPPLPACLLCSHPLRDGVTGFHILEEIEKRAWPLSTLLMASQWQIAEVVTAIKSGAEDCVALPVKTPRLLEALEQGLLRARQLWEHSCAIAEIRERAASLDEREVEVVKRVVRGCLNKEIADQLNLALVTVKVYRARAMKKLLAGNAAELARIASFVGLCDEESAIHRA
jgi:FixJ family two-component response regulator